MVEPAATDEEEPEPETSFRDTTSLTYKVANVLTNEDGLRSRDIKERMGGGGDKPYKYYITSKGEQAVEAAQ